MAYASSDTCRLIPRRQVQCSAGVFPLVVRYRGPGFLHVRLDLCGEPTLVGDRAAPNRCGSWQGQEPNVAGDRVRGEMFVDIEAAQRFPIFILVSLVVFFAILRFVTRAPLEPAFCACGQRRCGCGRRWRHALRQDRPGMPGGPGGFDHTVPALATLLVPPVCLSLLASGAMGSLAAGLPVIACDPMWRSHCCSAGTTTCRSFLCRLYRSY